MDDILRPAYAHALLSLRTLVGVQQQDLAASLGLLPKDLSRLERGHQPLERRALAAYLAALGFPASAIDLTLDWRQKVLRGRAGELDPAAAAEEAAAAQLGEAAAQSFRRALAQMGAEPARRREERRAAALWTRFERCSPRKQHWLVHGSREHQSWAFCVRLCEESTKAAAGDAGRALALATLAVAAAERATADPGWSDRLQGFAWGFLANARRVKGDLPGASTAFDTARALWEAGADPQNRLDGSRLDSLEASLRIEQRRFAEALTLLEQVAHAQPAASGAILLKKANLQMELGDHSASLLTLFEARSRMSQKDDPQSWLVLNFNICVNFWQLGRFEDALALLPEARSLAVLLGAGLRLVRILWLEGRISAGRGQRSKAVAILEQVRRELSERQIAFDAALVTLELAALYLEEGRTGEVQSLARGLAWIFARQGVPKETQDAVRVFCRAAHEEKASLELVRELLRRLLAAPRSRL